MENNKSKSTKRGTFITQFDLFGEPEVTKVRKPRRKMTEKEKEERKAERELKKKIEADKKFEEYWAKRGVFQGNLFSDDELDECERRNLKDIIREEVERALNEGGIDINPENKGKFTATKERTGKTTSELLDSPNKTTRARANFARMAKRHWKPLKK